MQQSLRTNNYWLNGVLARAQEKPEVLDWARTRLADVKAITTAELSALAKEYLGHARASRATVLPTVEKKGKSGGLSRADLAIGYFNCARSKCESP